MSSTRMACRRPTRTRRVANPRRSVATPAQGITVHQRDMRHLRHMASLDEVRITREPDGETALIKYADDAIGGTLSVLVTTRRDREWLLLASEEQLRAWQPRGSRRHRHARSCSSDARR